MKITNKELEERVESLEKRIKQLEDYNESNRKQRQIEDKDIEKLIKEQRNRFIYTNIE